MQRFPWKATEESENDEFFCTLAYQMNKNDRQNVIFSLTFLFFQGIFIVIVWKIVKKDKAMRNLTAAVFLAIVFFAVSANTNVFAGGSIFRRIVGRPRKMSYSNSFRDTLWGKDLKEWEKRNSAAPQSLPRAAFQLNKQSSSRSFRSSHRGFRSSHSHRTHVRRGRSHVRRRR